MKKIIIILLCIFLSSCGDDKQNNIQEKPEKKVAETPSEPVMQYGYNLRDYEVVQDTILSGDTFGELMERHEVKTNVYAAAAALNQVFNVRGLRSGKPFKILKAKDSTHRATAFIYEPNITEYVVLDMNDSLCAFKDRHPVTYKRRSASGIINSTLSEAMEEEGLGASAIWELSDIYRWSIDFFRLQKGDRFKMVFTERFINDSIYAGIDKIEAAVFETDGNPYYAFNYTTDSLKNISDYYDEKGKTLRSFFLKAPVEYTRISSRFTKRRFHPVQKRWKAHKGTDYAAPYHTPIVATANGVVTRSGYTRGNGNYVKIKHNNTYSTQYLHMTKRKVKVGQRVKQGQVIGTVGATGLATGPHVCYRFWVNGVQRDPYRLKLPSAEPLKKEYMEDYLKTIAPLKEEIDSIPFKNDPAIL